MSKSVGSTEIGSYVSADVTKDALHDSQLSDSSVPKPKEFEAGDVIANRFEIRNLIGRGGFGLVYAAFDHSLKRVVALKHSTGIRKSVRGELRREAQLVAALNHPNIVQVHDLVQVRDSELVIVMEYLEGAPLSRRLRHTRTSIAEAVEVVLKALDALLHAHQRQLVHSDLKPANLFLCQDGSLKLLDFGLAVARFSQGSSGRVGGTPGYMSPEQMRGESHLIDGRSDIWSLGVLLYEMISGVRPFEMDRTKNMPAQLNRKPTPLAELNPEVDPEMQRIVTKCLQPLIKSRYETVRELRDDLLSWQAKSTSEDGFRSAASALATVSPAMRLRNRGLQPFTEMDESVYYSLIPGPRDRSGLPDSIRFWRRWVESDDPETEYPVGVLYGPSGAGKTSYVRAGLLRRLDPDICSVYVECRPGDLAGRLTRFIESQISGPPEQPGRSEPTNAPNSSAEPDSASCLRELLHRFRRDDSSRQGFQKLLIVLDQFEAWAHTATLEERMSLAESLRQCDGTQVRALIVTRDDYWSGVKELLHWLELPMHEGRNVAAVDLLDPSHAERILESMGREVKSLPSEGQELSKAQSQFLKQAIEELTTEGSVVAVHLVMFAQMIRMRSWTPKALKESGGVVGACSLYFHELFDRTSNYHPEYRRVAPAAITILQTLLPPEFSTVNEVNIGWQELRNAVKANGDLELFDDALQVLCEELRVVSVVGASEGATSTIESSAKLGLDASSAGASPAENHFRLAHDFLVEPLADFLAQREQRTWRGRSKSRLVELSEAWSRRPHRLYLPSFVEFLALWAGTLFQRRTEKEARFMRAARQRHAGRIRVTLLTTAAFILMSVFAAYQWNQAQAARSRNLNSRVDLLINAPIEDYADNRETLRALGAAATEAVEMRRDSVDPQTQLRAEIFLQSADPQDFSLLATLLSQADAAWFDEYLAIAKQAPNARTELAAVAQDESDLVAAARAGILLAYLGDSAPLAALLQSNSDHNRDYAVLMEALKWRGGPEPWNDLVNSNTDTRVRYNAAMVLFSFPVSEWLSASNPIDYNALTSHVTGAMHSLGRHLAKRAGVDVADLDLNPPPGANWRIGPANIPFVRLEEFSYSYSKYDSKLETANKTEIESTRPLWIATIPVPRSLYEEFVAAGVEFPNDEKAEVEFDPKLTVPDAFVNDPTQPMLGTSHTQACMFCNWLSEREGLEPCYTYRELEPQVFERSKLVLRRPPWLVDEEANGYRLPNRAEAVAMIACGFESGIPWRHRDAYVTASGLPESDFPYPLYDVPPTQLGVFLFDQMLKTWTSGVSGTVSMATSMNGPGSGVLTHQIGVPGCVIFLVQNTEDVTD